MRVPVPTNRLVAFTLVGALLTAVVAGGLAFPGLVPGLTADSPGEATGAGTDTGRQLAADAPEPNQNFTPEVRTQSGYEEHEDEHEEEEYEDEHGEEEYEDEHEEEYEENGEEEHEENEGYED